MAKRKFKQKKKATGPATWEQTTRAHREMCAQAAAKAKVFAKHAALKKSGSMAGKVIVMPPSTNFSFGNNN